MASFRVCSASIEDAQERAAQYKQTRHGAKFARDLDNAREGLDTIGADDLQYCKDLIDGGAPFTVVLPNLYALGYERGQKAGRGRA